MDGARLPRERRPLLPEMLEISARVREAGAHQREPVVVARDPLEPPEEARVLLPGVVVGDERRGAKALHVPEVQELVGGERQGLLVGLAREEGGAPHVEGGAALVLEAAAPPVGDVDDEEVPIVGEPAHEPAQVLHDGLQIGGEPGDVQVTTAGDGHLVPLPQGLEGGERVGPDLHRRVAQLVVVTGGEAERPAVEGRGDPPARGRRDEELHRLVHPPLGVQEEVRAVPVAVGAVEVGGAHRGVVGVDAVADPDLRGSARLHPEAVLVEPHHRQPGPGAVVGLDALQVARELADQVAARGPDREGEDRRRPGRVEDGFHLEEVGMGLCHGDAVAHSPRMLTGISRPITARRRGTAANLRPPWTPMD